MSSGKVTSSIPVAGPLDNLTSMQASSDQLGHRPERRAGPGGDRTGLAPARCPPRRLASRLKAGLFPRRSAEPAALTGPTFYLFRGYCFFPRWVVYLTRLRLEVR